MLELLRGLDRNSMVDGILVSQSYEAMSTRIFCPPLGQVISSGEVFSSLEAYRLTCMPYLLKRKPYNGFRYILGEVSIAKDFFINFQFRSIMMNRIHWVGVILRNLLFHT
ncbi:hypothetical protein NPIL_244161 [Nephila pilipes]|uniref:Uncharacterized protein n=1 Tax=Nephila pilipes TaxID=299642 RepID=A0A8X6MIA2_NEPPI|nr:hypothetical protein NPIL_244161 [Nephila pilipes]